MINKNINQNLNAGFFGKRIKGDGQSHKNSHQNSYNRKKSKYFVQTFRAISKITKKIWKNFRDRQKHSSLKNNSQNCHQQVWSYYLHDHNIDLN